MNDRFIGTTVAKKITVNILNPDNQINLEDKEISVFAGIKINGVVEEIPFGNFIIEKPDNKEVQQKTSFVGYDYMTKFDVVYKDNNTYPISLQSFFINLCNQVGLQAGSEMLVNSNYQILGNPFTNNETCKTVLSAIAQLCGGFAKIGRDNKVHIVNLQNDSNKLTVEDVHVMSVQDLNTQLVNKLYDGSKDRIDGNNYDTSFQKNNVWGEVNSLILKLSDDVDGENTVREDTASITKNGLTEIVIAGNEFLINETEREKVIPEIWECLKGLKYLPFSTDYYGFPYLDCGDKIRILDNKDVEYSSYVLNHKFIYNGTFAGNITTKAITKTQTQYKNNIKTKFRNVQLLVDKINGRIEGIIEEVDENSEKMTQVLQTVDSITETVSNVTTNIESIKSDAVSEAIKEVEKELGVKLKDYPTTAEVSTIVTTKAGEIETRLNGTITTQINNKMGNYVTKAVMENHVTESINSFNRTISTTYLTKDEKGNFVEKNKVISSINQSAEAVSISANKIKWEGAVTANNYFKIGLDGSMEASSGTIAGINFDWSGLHYYGSDSHDGFGLYKSGQGWLTTDTPLGASSQIIFMAGGNGGHIGDAKFRLYQNGEMFAEKGKIGPFKVTANTLESDSVGISANEYYAFWTKISGTTTSFITWNGDISCKSIIVNGNPLVRTLGGGNCINSLYRDGNQLVAIMNDVMFIVLPDSVTSDKNRKMNIEDTKVNALDFYKKLHFRQFNMKESGEFYDLGLIAQELEKIDSSFVTTLSLQNGETTKLIQQAKFIMRNAKAIQELIDRLEKVEEKLGV